MTDEMRRLLRRGAAAPVGEPDVERIRGRVRRRRRTRRAATLLIPVAAIAIIALGLWRDTGDDLLFSPTPSATVEATPPPRDGASTECPDDFEERPEFALPEEGVHLRLDIAPTEVTEGEFPAMDMVNAGRTAVTFVTHTQIDRWVDGAWQNELPPIGYSVEIPLGPGEVSDGSLWLSPGEPLRAGCHRVLRWMFLPDERQIELSRLVVVSPAAP